MPPISVRQYCIAGVYWPINTERRIIPEKASIVLGRVIAINFINNLSRRFDRTKTVGKPRRNEDLVPLSGAEHDCDIPSKRRRTPTYIHSYIKHRARCYTQQLCLSNWRNLEMK